MTPATGKSASQASTGCLNVTLWLAALLCESGATTHAGVLSGCIEYFQARGVSDISVIEGSWVGDDTMRAMRRAGYDKVCEKYGVPFFDLKKDQTRPVKTAIGNIDICCRALDAGLLVDLPVLKGHCQTVMTCALKNMIITNSKPI